MTDQPTRDALHREIAHVESTFLGWEDHGILTVWVHMRYGVGHQGAGGYALDEYDDTLERRIGHKCGIDFITGVMRACGVNEWDKVKGRTVFAIRDGEGFGSKVVGLEPLPTESGEPFFFEDAFKEVVA